MLRIWNVLRADGSLSTRLGSGDVLPELEVDLFDSTLIAEVVAVFGALEQRRDTRCLAGH